MINRALKTSKQEARMARFKAEVADKEIARLKDELESSRRRERESRLRRRSTMPIGEGRER